MKKCKIIKSLQGYYLAVVLGTGLFSQISPFFSSVGRLAEWVDNYPDNITIIK